MPYDFRRFAPATKAIEAQWSNSACTNDKWVETGKKWATNTAPALVRNAAGLTGVKKPGIPPLENPYLAATEKVAADLAFQLGLPVPPVTLFDTGNTPRYVAISAFAFEQAFPWGQAKLLVGSVQGRDMIPAMSAMVPFESWIDAQDRQNEGNVVIGFEPSGRSVPAWIDYAFSMDYVWQGRQKLDCAVAPQYPQFGEIDVNIAAEVADRIFAMDDTIIEQILNRIPVEYLPRDSAMSILSNLLARRGPVRALW